MKGSKRDKGRSKINTKKQRGRKQGARTYLGNYDSRKEKIQMHQSNRIKKKGESIKEDNKSQGSGKLYGTGSDFIKEVEKADKSTFFKKKEKEINFQKVKSPMGMYKEIRELKISSKGGFLSKTDDLKFLKELAKEKTGKSTTRQRRGSSAYPKDKPRMVQSTHNSKRVSIAKTDPEDVKERILNSQKISGSNGEEVWNINKNKIDISKSLVMKKKKGKTQDEGTTGDYMKDIEFIKQKYLGKGNVRLNDFFVLKYLLILNRKRKTKLGNF
jgi:hypothetical protein